MKETKNDFVLIRGLYLGVFFSLFPLIDLFFGENMSLKSYFLIFYAFWFFITVYLISFFGKENRKYHDLFDFKRAFKVMFLISAIGLSLLTITRITLWNVLYPEIYIQLNEERDTTLAASAIGYAQSSLDEAYKEGSLSDDEYEESSVMFFNQEDQAKKMINKKWNSIKEEGVSKSFFISQLIYNLFFISVLNAVLALIIRRKQENI